MPILLGTPADAPEMAALWAVKEPAFALEWGDFGDRAYTEVRILALMAEPANRFGLYRNATGTLLAWVHVSDRSFIIAVVSPTLSLNSHRLRLREVMRNIVAQFPALDNMYGRVRRGSIYDTLFSAMPFLTRTESVHQGIDCAEFTGKAGDIAVSL